LNGLMMASIFFTERLPGISKFRAQIVSMSRVAQSGRSLCRQTAEKAHNCRE